MFTYLESVTRSPGQTYCRVAHTHDTLDILSASADNPTDDQRVNEDVACEEGETHRWRKTKTLVKQGGLKKA